MDLMIDSSDFQLLWIRGLGLAPGINQIWTTSRSDTTKRAFEDMSSERPQEKPNRERNIRTTAFGLAMHGCL
jgi:hypothetical protein